MQKRQTTKRERFARHRSAAAATCYTLFRRQDRPLEKSRDLSSLNLIYYPVVIADVEQALQECIKPAIKLQTA